jgi:hypothetical protein
MNPAASNEADRLVLAIEAKFLAESIQQEKQSMLDCQYQREKLNFFWLVDQNSLEQKKSELRNKERLKEDRHECHEAELHFLRDRVKHLLLEHNVDIATVQAKTAAELGFLHEELQVFEGELQLCHRGLFVRMKDVETEHREFMIEMTQEHAHKVEAIRTNFERRAQEVRQSNT